MNGFFWRVFNEQIVWSGIDCLHAHSTCLDFVHLGCVCFLQFTRLYGMETMHEPELKESTT
jgi:hypothetical protein